VPRHVGFQDRCRILSGVAPFDERTFIGHLGFDVAANSSFLRIECIIASTEVSFINSRLLLLTIHGTKFLLSFSFKLSSSQFQYSCLPLTNPKLWTESSLAVTLRNSLQRGGSSLKGRPSMEVLLSNARPPLCMEFPCQ
jgi:hypothetical protein